VGGEGRESVVGGTVVDKRVVGAEGLQTAEAATGTGTAWWELTHGGESCKGSGESRVNTPTRTTPVPRYSKDCH